MIEIPENSDMLDMARILEQNGFTVMSAEANRISLNMGYTEKGFADSDRVIKLRESRLFPTKEAAESSLPKKTTPRSHLA